MRTDSSFPIGLAPLVIALLVVGCIASGLLVSVWWVDEEVDPPESVETPLEREQPQTPPRPTDS